MYDLVKKSLFLMSPENAHDFAFFMGEKIQSSDFLFSKFKKSFPLKEIKPVELFGLKFPNPVGLAAGFDKNARIVPLLDQLGFGFVEVGTVTPLAQEGNPKPRLFRHPESHQILNRMGFNNYGMEALAKNIESHKKKYQLQSPLGVNLGKNKITSAEDALSDYVKLASGLKDHGDYFVVNVSSPNTPGLRDLQESAFLLKTAEELKKILQKPVLVKLAADLENSDLDSLVIDINKSDFDGLILCNTTIDKSNSSWAKDLGPGGISGRVLRLRSREMLMLAKARSTKPIISVGGVDSADEVQWRLDKGASLVQVYSELIFQGPYFVQSILQNLK
ncbi:MAG: dihydroorotate dehydrogenase (quinone) [Bdellovibrionaceae bacterium]|nr:dihydroorotate dehydrogenase (quinone) [Pseudobdellovibrionaceae bacterium]|tara:strand:- start:84184 stop:85182 length:999 start_codon:yes stop_codon:yes gene_type:complete